MKHNVTDWDVVKAVSVEYMTTSTGRPVVSLKFFQQPLGITQEIVSVVTAERLLRVLQDVLAEAEEESKS